MQNVMDDAKKGYALYLGGPFDGMKTGLQGVKPERQTTLLHRDKPHRYNLTCRMPNVLIYQHESLKQNIYTVG